MTTPEPTNPTLPLELLLLIADELPRRTLSSMSRTCRALHTLLSPRLATHFSEEAFYIQDFAIRRNDRDLLLRARAACPHKLQPDTFIWPAILSGSDKIVRWLLDQDVKWMLRNEMPLRIALDHGHMEVVKVLLEAGACWGRWCRNSEYDKRRGEEKEKLLLSYGGVEVDGAIVKHAPKIGRQRRRRGRRV